MKYRVITRTSPLNLRKGPGTDYEPVVDQAPRGGIVEVIPMAGWLPVLWENRVLWASAKYLERLPDEPEPEILPLPTPGGPPPWVTWAKSKVGVKELPGAGDNPEIIAWFKISPLSRDLWHDSTPWCAVFCHAALILNGAPGLPSMRAVEALQWGRAAREPQAGDLVIFAWASGGHHVAIFLALEGERVRVVGGNQSDAVTITTYPRANVVGYRRAMV